jgi:hypothetical protein
MRNKEVVSREDGRSDGSQRAATYSAIERIAAAVSRIAKRAATSSAASIDPTSVLTSTRQLRAQLADLHAVASRLAEFETELGGEEAQELMELESSLRAACRDRGWRVEGSWPLLFIERGPSVEIDEAGRSVTVGGTKIAGCNLGAIVAALAPIIDELFERKFTSEQFAKDLSMAYDQLASRAAQVPIFDVYRMFVTRAQSLRFWRDARASAFRGISTDQFRSRISRMLEEGAGQAPDGRELRFLPPLDPADGIFIYQPSERRFGWVGRLEFVSAMGRTESTT